MRFPAAERATLAIERQITKADLDQKLQARLNFANNIGHHFLLRRRQFEIVDVTRGRFGRLLAELMNVELASFSIFDRHRENFRLQPRAAARFARVSRHERANTVSRKFALRLLIKPLHLRHQTFKWSLLLAVAAEIHFDRRPVGPEVKRVFEFVR